MTAATPPTSTDLSGLDLPALDAHLREIGVARSGELTGRLLSGGRSNLTFLVADDAGFITGSTLSINGGQHMY